MIRGYTTYNKKTCPNLKKKCSTDKDLFFLTLDRTRSQDNNTKSQAAEIFLYDVMSPELFGGQMYD